MLEQRGEAAATPSRQHARRLRVSLSLIVLLGAVCLPPIFAEAQERRGFGALLPPNEDGTRGGSPRSDESSPSSSAAAPDAPRQDTVAPRERSAGAVGSGEASVEGDQAHEVDPERLAPATVATKLRPPSARHRDIEELWAERAANLSSLDMEAASEATARLVEIKRELAIASLPTMSLALIREGTRHLERGDVSDARASAALALELSPSLPAASWFMARVALASKPPLVFEAASLGGRAAWLEMAGFPQNSQNAANAAARAYLGLLAAGLVFLGLLLVRGARRLLHDFHHLFPKAASRVHTGLLAVALIVSPAALGAGALLVVMAVAALVWLHAENRERVLIAVVLASLALVAPLTNSLADLAGFWGTRAEPVWRVERTGGGAEALLALEESVEEGGASWQELFALGRHHKRHGDLERAVSLYDAAARLEPGEPAVHVNLGVVLYAQGDLAGAATAFRRATDLDPALAGVWHNLSKVYLRLGEAGPGREARRRAVDLDPSVSRERPDHEDRLNLALAEASLSDRHMRALAGDGSPDGDVARAALSAIAGPIPERAAPIVPALLIPSLAAAGWLISRRRLSATCVKCGGSACERCRPGVASGRLCHECATPSMGRSGSSPQERNAREVRARRYATRREITARIASFLVPGSGHVLLEMPLRGALFLTSFGVGAALLLPWTRPFPSALSFFEGPSTPSLVIGAVLVAGVWLVSNVSLWRRDY